MGSGLLWLVILGFGLRFEAHGGSGFDANREPLTTRLQEFQSASTDGGFERQTPAQTQLHSDELDTKAPPLCPKNLMPWGWWCSST